MIKRIFDIIFSSIGLVTLSPILLIISIWIKLDSKGPIFFRQIRLGKKGKKFKIHKFRSMKLESEIIGKLTIGNDSRITKSGYYIRKYKLDELAQLIDVLIGNMSLVGPRPEVPEFFNFYSKNSQNKILSIRPGITDLASIEMINENEILSKYENPKEAYIKIIMPIKEKYYLEYIEKNNIILDLKIIFKTVLRIIRRN